MTLESAARFAAVLVASALATELLARLAPRVGWTDAPRGADAARKRQRRPVPAVGGAALLLALLAAPERPWDCGELELLGRHWPEPLPLSLSASALFAVGTIDDRWPLRAGRKTLLQLVALLPLALGGGGASGGSPATSLALLAGGLVAINVLNTFDNSDGALASLAAVGFLAAQPYVAAAVLGFLPLNTDSRRARNRTSGAPSAYLGDAGAFVLGFLVLATPRAWGTLVLPLCDLARLAIVRLAAGSRPWVGDRRHLAHRMLARGLSPSSAAGVQLLVAAPACVFVACAVERGDARFAWAGVASTAALFALAVRCTRFPRGPELEPVPCPRESALE